MPPKKNSEETTVETTTVDQVGGEVSGDVTLETSEASRKEALLEKAVALSAQVEYYNGGIHGVDGNMSYTLAVAPPAMIALRELLTLLRAEIKG